MYIFNQLLVTQPWKKVHPSESFESNFSKITRNAAIAGTTARLQSKPCGRRRRLITVSTMTMTAANTFEKPRMLIRALHKANRNREVYSAYHHPEILPQLFDNPACRKIPTSSGSDCSFSRNVAFLLRAENSGSGRTLQRSAKIRFGCRFEGLQQAGPVNNEKCGHVLVFGCECRYHTGFW